MAGCYCDTAQIISTSAQHWEPSVNRETLPFSEPLSYRRSFVSAVVIKYPERFSAKEERLVRLTVPGYSPSLQGSQTGP